MQPDAFQTSSRYLEILHAIRSLSDLKEYKVSDSVIEFQLITHCLLWGYFAILNHFGSSLEGTGRVLDRYP